MMTAQLIEPQDPRWSSCLADADHDFYHVPAYVTLCADQERGRPAGLFVTDGRRSMLLPLIIRPIPLGGEDATSPYGYPGPLVSGSDDESYIEAALREGSDLLASQGIVSLFVRMHPLLNSAPIQGPGDVIQNGETVSVDLRLTDDEHWHQTISGHRNQINRAARNGSVAELDGDWRYFAEFKALYRATMERVSASDYYLFDNDYFDQLRSALSDRLRLWVVKASDGRVSAGGLFVESSGIVQYHLGASDPDFSRESPTKLLIHTVRKWAKEQGHRSFHLGGGLGSERDSLLKFKAGFSPLRHPYYTLRAVLLPDRYRELSQLRATTASGTLKAGYFPSYRAPTS